MTGSSVYDVTVGGLDFFYATDANNPMIRQTVPYTKDRVDQAEDAGEQTLTAWWVKSQETFHGGAGQLNLEPAAETAISHSRYLVSKNVDPFSTPGVVKRLPDTARISANGGNSTALVAASIDGVDWVFWLETDSGPVRGCHADGSSATTFTFVTLSAPNYCDLATDGTNVFMAATSTTSSGTVIIIYRLNPSTPTSNLQIATSGYGYSNDIKLGWAKSRLMMGVSNQIHEIGFVLDGSAITSIGSDTLRYTHPTPSWSWKCFASAPQAVLAAGDAGGVSTITSLGLQSVSGVPTLVALGDVAELPIGERITAMLGVQGSFLALGTNHGVRVGTYDTYTGALSLGPLTLDSSQPQLYCWGLVARDRFIYSFGQAYDEGGCVVIDLGTQVDQAGRYAWSPGLILPQAPTNPATTLATNPAMLPNSNRIVFSAGGFSTVNPGVYVEGASPGTAREAWLQTSRIRYGTVEPKIFQRLRVRGTSATATITAAAVTDLDGTATSCGTFSLLSSTGSEQALPALGVPEWLTLTFSFSQDNTCLFNSYGVKALPGTPRERHIQLSLMCYDSETSRNGQTKRQKLSARTRVSNLEALDTAGNVTTLVEHTPKGDVSTVVVIEDCQFKMDQRSTNTSDWGGTVTLLLRTVGA